MKELKDLRNVGKAVLQDLNLLNIKTVETLSKQDPYVLFSRLQKITNSKQNPCVLDVFMAIIHEAQTGEGIPWWYFTPVRKKGRN